MDERLGAPRGRQVVLARRALPDAAEPHLSRQDRSQGPIPSWRAHADHRSATVGCRSGAARRQYRPAPMRQTNAPAQPPRRHDVDGDGNRMTPSHAGKDGAHYRYYISGSLITKDRTETSAGLRIPAVEIEHLVSSRLHEWLLDPGSIYKSTWGRLTDASMQQRLVARAADIGRHWPELPVPRKRAVLTALIERIEVRFDQIDIHL